MGAPGSEAGLLVNQVACWAALGLRPVGLGLARLSRPHPQCGHESMPAPPARPVHQNPIKNTDNITVTVTLF